MKTSILCQYAPARTVWKKRKKTLIMAFNLEMIVSARAHLQLSNMHRTKTHLEVPNRGNNEKTAILKYKLLLVMNRADWMKGICRIRFRGRHFSPSLPGDRYLNLGFKSDHRAEISANIARFDAQFF